MNIRLVGKNNETLDLFPNWSIKNIPYTTRNQAGEAVFLDGGQNIGTNRYNSILLSINGSYKYNASDPLKNRTVDDYISYLMAWMRDRAPFRIFEMGLGRDTRYLESCYLMDTAPDSFLRSDYAKFEIKVLVLNPFWLEPETPYTGIINDMDEFSITNTGDYETYPIFTITATNPNPLFRLINKTEQNRRTEISYPFFNAGDIITINSFDNQITCNNLNISEFGNGNFLRLLPGVNTIKYTGNTVNISVSWQKRRTY